jgi:hypothetical protein
MLLTVQLGVSCSYKRCNVQDVKLTQGVDRATMLNQFQIMNKNMKRIRESTGANVDGSGGLTQ